MSLKEANQFDAIIKFDEGLLTRKEAALIAGLSERQITNKRKRYIKEGKEGLLHKNRGRPSPRRLSEELLNKIFNFFDEVKKR